MPELPEVETIKRELDRVLPGRKITGIKLQKNKMLQSLSPQVFESRLINQKIHSLKRRGKFLIVNLHKQNLIIHLGMSGQILFPHPAQVPDQHTHMIIELSDHNRLFFRDPRMFGRYALINDAENKTYFAHLGPEPLERNFTSQYLQTSIQNRKAAIKALLLQQQVVAGIGNIYADEALFRAGILPQTPGGKLSTEQIKKLTRSVRQVLKTAIFKGGTSLSDFLDPRHRKGSFQYSLQVYGRAGQACYQCRSKILKSNVAQRGTHWCPKCQK